MVSKVTHEERMEQADQISVSFRISKATHRMLQVVARMEQRSLAFIMRELLEHGLRDATRRKLRMPLSDGQA